jgi:ATP-binding protein involved in chromosome partitioning
MARPSETQVLAALKSVNDPDRAGDIVSLGMIGGLVVRDGNVQFAIEVEPSRGPRLEPLRKEAERAVEAIPGVMSVTAVLTAPTAPPREAQPQRGPQRPAQGSPQGPAPHGQDQPARKLLADVRAIVAVASGKGGVGKSTTAVNLALAFAAAGLRTGILDADIYGPSLPVMLGISERPRSPDGKTLLPIEKYGLRCMSIGFMVAPDTPMIWRGPMVMGALEQMMRDVEWGALDMLVVDMPPGTGDAQLTLAQRVPLAGAVIVSTPQDLALLDARRGLNMFRRVDVPVLGIVENMSYFVCPHCGTRSDIFTHGGARRAAGEMGVEFLGEIPLDMAIRETSDGGRPIVVADPGSPHARAYRDIAERIRRQLADRAAQRDAPRIVVQ